MTTEATIPPDMVERIRKMIRDEIAVEARAAPLRNARISGKGHALTVSDGAMVRVMYPEELGGGVAVYVGDIYSVNDGSYQGTGMLLQAPDGTDLAVFRTDESFGTSLQNIYDSGGRIMLGNDAASGQGLARPYIPGTFYPTRYADMTVATTSATFETLFATTIYKQHPKVAVGLNATMDTAGTTGEVRVLVNGTPLGPTVPAGFVITGSIFGPGAVAGAHMASLQVEIQGRRTSASGALRVQPSYLIGLQS